MKAGKECIARKDWVCFYCFSFGKDSLGKQRSGSGKRWHYVSYDLFHDWITGAETKVVCRAKNKDDLLRAVEAAKELGMEEYKDYFLIYDACRTELEKESPTCIGFRPMDRMGNGALYYSSMMKRENIIFALIVEKR